MTAEMDDLVQGARVGTVLYLRMAEWALDPACLATIADFSLSSVSSVDQIRIAEFSAQDLVAD